MKTHTATGGTSSVTTAKPSGQTPLILSPSSSATSPRSVRQTSQLPPQNVLRDSSNVFSSTHDYVDDDDDDDAAERLVIDLDHQEVAVGAVVVGSPPTAKLSPTLPPSVHALSRAGDKMSTVSPEQHEATVDKGLKMKIKRKNMTGKDSNNCNLGKSECNSENNGANMLQNSPPQAATNNSMPSPFEKLKQAILEREKTTKGPAQKGLHQRKEHHHMKKGNSPLSGNSAVAMGSPSGNPSGISLNGVGDSDRGTNSSFTGSQKSGDLSSSAPDPYEFNVKVEDSRVVGFPVSKKLKMEKHDVDVPIRVDVGVECGGSVDAACMTEPDKLGPCDPGTHITLEGIVWNETESMLVVNVTWRNRSYVGTLMDSTKHQWAPPCFRSDSPSDIDSRTPGRGGRGKRGRQTMNSTGGRGRSTRSSHNPHATNVFAVPASPVKCEKRRLPSNDEVPPAKRTRSGCSTPGAEPVIGEEGYIECPEPNCGKRYKHANGLKYHQSHAHKDAMLKVQNGDDMMDTEEEVIVSLKDSEDNSETIVKKEKKKKNRDGKKKKGKKTAEVPISHGENNDSASKLEDNSKNVSAKQPTLQVNLKPVSVATKTVTAPIATVPVESGSYALSSDQKSKKYKDKGDKKAIKTEPSEDVSKESRHEKKAKKKKKDKNREKHPDQKPQIADKLESKQDNDSKDIKPVIASTEQQKDSPSKSENGSVDLQQPMSSQQPMNLSNKTETPQSPRLSTTTQQSNTPEKSLPKSGDAQSPAQYSDITDDGNDDDTNTKEREEKRDESSTSDAVATLDQQHSTFRPVFSPHQQSPHSIINLTTKERHTETAQDSNKEPKEGAPADTKPPGVEKYGIPPQQYGFPPGFQYNMDPYSNMPFRDSTVSKQVELEKKRVAPEAASKSLSPHHDQRKMDKTPTRVPVQEKPRDLGNPRTDQERQLGVTDISRLGIAPEQIPRYISEQQLQQQQREQFFLMREHQFRERERKVAAAQASPAASSPSTSGNHEKKEHLHSPLATTSKPDVVRTLEDRLRAPEDRVRSEDRVRGSPSPLRSPTPASRSESSSSTPRSTPSSLPYSHPYLSPHNYAPGMYPHPNPFMFPPGYPVPDGKTLEMLQQQASLQQQQQQQHERIREAQGSPSASRHLMAQYPAHMYYPGALSSPAARMGPPK